MSAILEKYEAVKAEAIAAEGWLVIHRSWLVACALCVVVGCVIGWKFL